MGTIAELSAGLRSKNAGPFWITIDIFFATEQHYRRAVKGICTNQVAAVLQQDEASLKRFDLDSIQVIKFSFPRSIVQGHRFDRDMHGAQFAWLLNDIEVSG